jgi:hypothetical protein
MGDTPAAGFGERLTTHRTNIRRYGKEHTASDIDFFAVTR